jgi:hypothetical protein
VREVVSQSEFEQGSRSVNDVSDRLPVFDIRAGPFSTPDPIATALSGCAPVPGVDPLLL